MTEIAYTRQGDYNLPNLTLPEQPKVELGMYAQMRRRFLKEHHKILYYNLLTKCKLIENLYETEQTALKMENDLIRQMAQDQGVTEQLKAQDQMIIKETDQHHQNNADAETDQLSAIQLGRGILYSDQSAIIECTDQCDQQIIKFSERKSLEHKCYL